MVLQEEKVDSSLEFLILASDGLWDVVSNEVCHHFHFLLFFFTNIVHFLSHKDRNELICIKICIISLPYFRGSAVTLFGKVNTFVLF